MTIFGKRIKILKEELGLTNRQMSEMTGVDKGNFSSWMIEYKMPNSDSVIKICKAFNVSADWLLGLSDVREIKKNE